MDTQNIAADNGDDDAPKQQSNQNIDIPKLTLKGVCLGLAPLICILFVLLFGLIIYSTANNEKPDFEQQQEMLPIPGVPFVFGNGSFTLNETVKYMKNDTSLKCEFDIDSNGKLKTNSYVQMNDDIITDLEIGSFLIMDDYLMDILPSQCTKYPALAITNIEKSGSLLTIYVREANFWEVCTCYIYMYTVNYKK